MGLQREYDTDLDPVRQKILDLLLEGRTNLKNASIAMGRNSAYLHQFIHRGTPRILAEHDREALAARLGCAPEELKHDRMPPRKPRPKPAPRKEKEVMRLSAPAGPPEGYMAVPEIDVRAAAGPGAFNEGFEETREMWFFADPVIRHEFRARPADLRMITIDGDSMEPLLASGDRILIDVGRRIPVPPGIFVIWDGMGLVAKRIEHAPNSEPPKLIIKSVNPQYDTYQRDAEEVHLIGRVVWTARRL